MLTSDQLHLGQEKIGSLNHHSFFFDEKLLVFCNKALQGFKKISLSYAFFQVGFTVLAILECFACLSFFSFLTKSSILAFSLASIFLTVFSFFVLRFYFQAKKPLQIASLKNEFIENCVAGFALETPSYKYHQLISDALYRLNEMLELKKLNYYYPFLKKQETFDPLLKKFTYWMHGSDLFKMKESLLLGVINEHLQLVKLQPTDLETHAALAHAYLTLSKLYQDREFTSLQIEQKFSFAAQRAIEEFKILDAYAPNDPWVHAQLASIYHELSMPEQEIHHYETMLKNAPQDQDILFRLGVLYFEQGQNAKALHLYEHLKKAKDKRADELISFYDACQLQDAFSEEFY